MILEVGEKIFVAHRRLYEGDPPRFFAGIVDQIEEGVARVTGHSWTQDKYSGTLRAKSTPVSKLIPVSSAMLITYVLPLNTNLEQLELSTDENQTTLLVDGETTLIDLTERTFRRTTPA